MTSWGGEVGLLPEASLEPVGAESSPFRGKLGRKASEKKWFSPSGVLGELGSNGRPASVSETAMWFRSATTRILVLSGWEGSKEARGLSRGGSKMRAEPESKARKCCYVEEL